MNRRDKILAECIGEEPPPCQAACPLDIRVREQMRFLKEGRTGRGPGGGAGALPLSRHPGPHLRPALRGRLYPRLSGRGHRHRRTEEIFGRPGPGQPGRKLLQVRRGRKPSPWWAAARPGSWPPMSCRLKGYRVTLFEAEAHLGGALRLYMPAYRLPREVLDRETGLLQKLGVEVRLRTRLGRDIQLEELRRDFAAVFLAVGCHKSLLLEAAGEHLSGVWYGLDFLKTVNSGTPPEVGPRVAVIGGGDAALDAARTARQAGRPGSPYPLSAHRGPHAGPGLGGGRGPTGGGAIPFPHPAVPHFGRWPGPGAGGPKDRTGGTRCPGRPCARAGGRLRVSPWRWTRSSSRWVRPRISGFSAPAWRLTPPPRPKLEADPVCLATPIPGVFAGGDLVTGPGSRGGRLCRRPPGRPGHRLLTCKAEPLPESCRP